MGVVITHGKSWALINNSWKCLIWGRAERGLGSNLGLKTIQEMVLNQHNSDIFNKK